MAKRNVRAKAKSAVAAIKHKAQEAKAQLNKKSRQEQLLHKTLTPKKTITKKEKSAEKHKKLLNRFAQLKKERKEAQAKTHRQKTAVIGDLKPLRDALPSLQDIYKLVKSKKHDPTEQNAFAESEQPHLSVKQKIKQKRENMVKRVQSFEKLIKDKNFKQNPRKTITAHMRNKYKTMDADDDDE